MDKKDFESLLNKYPDCVSDGKKLSAFLKDLYPDVPKAILNTLTIMADDGIISEIKMSPESSSLVSARLQKKLEDDYGLSQNIISKCFSLISDNAKQTESTISAYTHEKITGFIDNQPKIALRKEGSQKHDIVQPEYNPKDFEIVKGVLKKYKGSSSVVVIPDSVTSIGDDAFWGCTGLTRVTIPDSVTSIGDYAFSGCNGLTSITIPNSVTSIGVEAFYNTLWYNNQPNGLVYAGKVAYKYKGTMPSNTSIVLKEGTLGITNSAFWECTGLTSITIPDSVTSIGDDAFHSCTGLTSVTIGNSVTSIGGSAFYYCTGLTSVTIGNSVTSIGYEAFEGCTGLTSVTIGNSVTSIGDDAFIDCTGLTSITVAKGNTKYHSAGNCLIETESKTLIAGCKNSIIPTDGSVTSIGGAAVSGCKGLTSVTIPDSVTSIGDLAFEGCTGLTSVTIPDSVTSIGSCAFDWCRNLTIYCEAESEPIGWFGDWNYEDRPVVWGVKK